MHKIKISAHKEILIYTKSGGSILSDFKFYYKAIIIKIVCYLKTDKGSKKWNRMKSPEIDPYRFEQQISQEHP